MKGIEEKLDNIAALLSVAKIKNHKASHNKNVSAVKKLRAILMEIIKEAKSGREDVLEQRKAHVAQKSTGGV